MQSDSITPRCHHSFLHNSRSNSSSSRSSDRLPIKLPICAIRDNSGRIFGKYRARCAPVMDTAGVTLYSVLGSKLQVETCVQAHTQVDLFAWYVHVLWRWSDQDDSDAIWLQIFWRFFFLWIRWSARWSSLSIMLETAQDKLDVVGQPATSLRFCIKNKSKTSLSIPLFPTPRAWD